jgi:proline racemase
MIDRVISVIDTHTAGEPTRIIVGGLPRIRGQSMLEKRNDFEKNYDQIRTMILREPRGHNDMFGAALVEPVNPDADLGVIFMSTGDYPRAYPYMCGHGAIGLISAAVELGMVKKTEPLTKVRLDTPDGLVLGWASVRNDQVIDVEIENVPAFLYQKDLPVKIAGMGEITVDIAFNGGFFILCPARALGLSIVPDQASRLAKYCLKLRDAVNETIHIDFKEKSYFQTVDVVELYDKPDHPDAHCKNVVVFGAGQMDRSPCGTGTSAKMASLFARGELKINEVFINESITGTLFKGRVVRAYEENGFLKVIPRISSQAYITGINQLISHKEDPMRFGLQLR